MRTKLGVVLLGCIGAVASWSCTSEPGAGVPAETPVVDGGGPGPDETTSDAGTDGGDASEATFTGKCADVFGDKLTAGFGRIDGVVYAVEKPSDTQCTLPNSDHVIVQVWMNGAVYRLVANVQSTGAVPEVRFAAVTHAMPAPAFAEGWHVGAALDYPTMLDAHNAAFAPSPMTELVEKVAAEVKVGAKISIYAESGEGRPESAHNIHRTEKAQQDGAIVIDPTGSPRFLLFHFDGQVF